MQEKAESGKGFSLNAHAVVLENLGIFVSVCVFSWEREILFIKCVRLCSTAAGVPKRKRRNGAIAEVRNSRRRNLVLRRNALRKKIIKKIVIIFFFYYLKQ